MGAAIANRRVLGRAEASIMAAVGAVLLCVTAIGIAWPLVLAAPIVLFAAWVGIALVVRALELCTGREANDGGRPEASRGWEQDP